MQINENDFSVLEIVGSLTHQRSSTVTTMYKITLYELDHCFILYHVLIATLPGMWERTITIGSAGKTFSITGWKVTCRMMCYSHEFKDRNWKMLISAS